MSTINTILKKLCPDVFEAKDSTNSELYKVMLAIAEAIDDARNQMAELLQCACPHLSSGIFLTMLSRGYGQERFLGEADESYKKRFKAFLGMPKNSANYILDILQLYTITRPTITEGPAFYFTVGVATGGPDDPNYAFSIGGPPDWGCGIGDTGVEFAGAIYASMSPGAAESLTYLQYILDEIKPAGTVATAVAVTD